MNEKTNASRQADYRRRQREAGRIPLLIWVHQDNKEQAKTMAKELEDAPREKNARDGRDLVPSRAVKKGKRVPRLAKNMGDR